MLEVTDKFLTMDQFILCFRIGKCSKSLLWTVFFLCCYLLHWQCRADSFQFNNI